MDDRLRQRLASACPFWRFEMKVYTYSEARQNLATLLDEALRDSEVRITRRDGSIFSVRPMEGDPSPLDVPGIETDFTREEIVDLIREGRDR
jgi:antitoxin (DNA-binding transcriptional repressor) of toxin-antitoxin stability system